MSLIFKKVVASNLANIQLSSSDVKLYKNSSIKVSIEAAEFLGITKNDQVYIDKLSGRFYIACIPTQFDENGEEIKIGKKLGANNSFANKTLHTLLGGELSEWDIDKEDFVLDGAEKEEDCFKFYALKEKVNGVNARKALKEEVEADEVEAKIEEAEGENSSNVDTELEENVTFDTQTRDGLLHMDITEDANN